MKNQQLWPLAGLALTLCAGSSAAQTITTHRLNTVAPPGLSTQGGGVAVVSADFDTDGSQDFAVLYNDGWTAGNPPRIEVVRRIGTTTSVMQTIVPPITATARTLDVGDIDNDGLPDLVAFFGDLGGPGRFYWFRNTGGSFVTEFQAPSVAGTRDAALADMNGDGFIDLIAARLIPGANDQVDVYFNSGGFGITSGPGGVPNAFQMLGAASPAPFLPKIDLADLNGDGAQDILALSGLGSTPTVQGLRVTDMIANNFFAGYPSPPLVLLRTLPTPNASDVAAVQMDGNATADPIVADLAFGSTFCAIFGYLNGGLNAPTFFTAFSAFNGAAVTGSTLTRTNQLITLDWNGDGANDAASVDTSGFACLFGGNSTGAMNPGLGVPLCVNLSGGQPLLDMTAGDFDSPALGPLGALPPGSNPAQNGFLDFVASSTGDLVYILHL